MSQPVKIQKRMTLNHLRAFPYKTNCIQSPICTCG